jgi:hypothetical protein
VKYHRQAWRASRDIEFSLLETYTAMAEAPPPSPPPMADRAHPALTAFMHRLIRDYIPVGVAQQLVHQAIHNPIQGDPDLEKVADSMARELSA